MIRRGKRICNQSKLELIENESIIGRFSFRVRDDIYNSYYKVNIDNCLSEDTIALRCSCSYNMGDICRHKVAALFTLQDLVDTHSLVIQDFQFSTLNTLVRLPHFSIYNLKNIASAASFAKAEEYLRTKKARIVSAKNERVEAEITMSSDTAYHVVLHRNEKKEFNTSCDCGSEKAYPLCTHKIVLFLQILNSYGFNYFDSIRDVNATKTKLLAEYGFSLTDDLKGKFEFIEYPDKITLKVLDSSIKKISQILKSSTESEQNKMLNLTKALDISSKAQVVKQDEPKERLGIVIGTIEQFPYITFDCVYGLMDTLNHKVLGKLKKIDLKDVHDLSNNLSTVDKKILNEIRALSSIQLQKAIESRNVKIPKRTGGVFQYHQLNFDQVLITFYDYILTRFKALYHICKDDTIFFVLPEGKKMLTENLKPIYISEYALVPSFVVSKDNLQYDLGCVLSLPYATELYTNAQQVNNFFSIFLDVLYLWKSPKDIILMSAFKDSDALSFSDKEIQEVIVQDIIPLFNAYQVSFKNFPYSEISDLQPEVKIKMFDKDDNLLLRIIFSYYGTDIDNPKQKRLVTPTADKGLLFINRNIVYEEQMIRTIKGLHSNFEEIPNTQDLVLKKKHLKEKDWFIFLSDELKKLKIALLDTEGLDQFRFNTNKIQTKVHIEDDNEWFNTVLDVKFGEHHVPLELIRDALASKRNTVELPDRTLGILPDEWINRYSSILKIGKQKANNVIALSKKYHFNLIEELYDNRNKEEVFMDMDKRYKALKQNFTIKKIPPPKRLKAKLRDYQIDGFHWLNFLTEVGWGGILADDMGLGKTVQTLALLQYAKERNENFKAIVVCPNTLLFNWVNEIKKFTTDITYYIHHGRERMKLTANKHIKEHVFITTYGTLRSDIRHISELKFDFIILDESQAIKNYQSKITKAACLLKGGTRLCLTGTPLQNNTFDIYAQMNFLNPYMLGSVEYFHQEFSMPIDKMADAQQKMHLRKILYPFILRRTKEQVAPDLPPKQEMVIYCEMGDEQRKIYEIYRSMFREKVITEIDKQGLQRSSLTILQGLMKLRQICDSPSILKEKDEHELPNASTKLDELSREMVENISEHKVLIFSQFLGMLALLKERFKELGIIYEYFDGSNTNKEREASVNRFQNDSTCRAFLISLKAGGVGLNLTSADYVYIVDPWWNPAVEEQAIDRVHRIGQKKNVFAYKMICRNTVEDKILQLQERKRSLAKEVITKDVNFVKNLTKEDVEFLFS